MADIAITATMDAEVAWQFAQFCKRLMLDRCLALAEKHLGTEERERWAYQMLESMEAVQAASRQAGIAPR